VTHSSYSPPHLLSFQTMSKVSKYLCTGFFGLPSPFIPSTHKVIGNIAAFDNIPMAGEQNQTAILRIFAARAGDEIDRLTAWEKLEIANKELQILLAESEERFPVLFEDAPIAYVQEGLDSKFIKVNRAAP
jgi:hypothetical protein